MNYRTDLALERTVYPGGLGEGVTVQRQQEGPAEVTWVRVMTETAAQRLGKPVGTYWTLTDPRLPEFSPQERTEAARRIAQMLRLMLPPEGNVLVLGLGNRRMTADALGDKVVSGVLVTRHMQDFVDDGKLRSVCALSPGVMGVTGLESAEMASSLVERLHPAAVLVVDALAAMETSHIGAAVQLTDAGIHPGSGVGNHRTDITADTLGVPVIAIGVPMVVYASTIVRDALTGILSADAAPEEAHRMAEQLTQQAHTDLVVTPRNIDEMVAGLADMLALAINSALQPGCSMEELSLYLH